MLLVREHAGRQLIAACCRRAAASGVRIDMTTAHARALLQSDDVIIADHEPERDEAALAELAAWCIRFTPTVAVDPPDGLLLDITGCDRLYRGERNLLARIASDFEQLRIAARLAIAPTVGAAWACARYGSLPHMIVPPAELDETLDALPVAALRVDPATVHALHELAVDRIGDVRRLARKALPARFGDELLRHLDQARGAVPESITPVRPEPPVVQTMVFDGPTTQVEAIHAAAIELLGEMETALLRRESVAGRFSLTLDRAMLDSITLTTRVSTPTRDASHVYRLLQPGLETAPLGHGVDSVIVRVLDVRRAPHRQLAAFDAVEPPDPSSDDAALGQFIDTLAARIGPERITRMAISASHAPERCCVHTPAFGPTPKLTEAVTDADRPSILLDPPLPVEVRLADDTGRPRVIDVRGERFTLIAIYGPERLCPPWWRGRARLASSPTTLNGAARNRTVHDVDTRTAEEQFDPFLVPPARSYFIAHTACGRHLWLYRDAGDGRWRLHGWWA
jgi:protein ImuB